MLTGAVIIPFIRGILADGSDAEVGVIAAEGVVCGVTAGEGVVVADGAEAEGCAVFFAPAMANNENPAVSDLKYAEALSSPILKVGRAFHRLSLYLLNVIVAASMLCSVIQLLFTLNSMVAFVMSLSVRLVVVRLK